MASVSPGTILNVKDLGNLVGASLAGPVGGLLGGLLGSLLQPVVDKTINKIWDYPSDQISDAIRKKVINRGAYLVTRMKAPPKDRINHHIQLAFQEAFLDAVYDLGGAECFPSVWRAKVRDVPQTQVYPLSYTVHPQFVNQTPVAAQVRTLFTSLEQGVKAGTVLPLNPPKDKWAGMADAFLEEKTEPNLDDNFFQQIVQPFLAHYKALCLEQPELPTFLRRHLLDRTLIHFNEHLKDAGHTEAWRAFNRLILEEVRHILYQIKDQQQADDSVMLRRLDAIENQLTDGKNGDDPQLAQLAELTAQLIEASGRIEKGLDDTISGALVQVIAEHGQLMARLDETARSVADLNDIGLILIDQGDRQIKNQEIQIDQGQRQVDLLQRQVELLEQIAGDAPKRFSDSLYALRDLMNQPEIYQAVSSFRTEFSSACSQLEVLADYKDLHDQLHNLQFGFYNVIERVNGESDEDYLDRIQVYLPELDSILEQLHQICAGSQITVGEQRWVREVERARDEIYAGVENCLILSLKKGLLRLKQILAVQPTCINQVLTDAAKALRLSGLLEALKKINAQIDQLNLQSKEVDEFAAGLDSLAQLNRDVWERVADHDRWQAMDNELRLKEALIAGKDLDDLVLFWPDLLEKAGKLYRENHEEWAINLIRYENSVSEAVSLENPVKIRRAFQKYRKGIGTQFFTIDCNLKRMCNELRTIGRPLEIILNVLQ